MNKTEISTFIDGLSKTKERNIVVVDFANVDRWQDSLNWSVGIKKLGQLVSHIAYGKKYLRRFYYGEDYGPKDKSTELLQWSETVIRNAKYSNFEVVSKRVKYIPDDKYSTGYIKKCNLDIEMAVDLIKEKDKYDTAVVFSGDGDLAYVFDYIYKEFGKKIYLFGARNHVGKELIEAKSRGVVSDIVFAEDFEYRLNLKRP